MFFTEQIFEGIDLSGYSKTDISIPRTNVHIYGFECKKTDSYNDSLSMAKKLDELTQNLTDKYGSLFRVVSSESSQFFCSQIYPLIVSFETKLRYALYVSRSLFENGNVNGESFQYSVGKKQKDIEETDFGEIYEAVFTDKDFQGKVSNINGRKLTKADLIKKIQEIDENSVWPPWSFLLYIVKDRPQSAFDPFQAVFGYFLDKAVVQIFDVILYDTFGRMGLGRQNDMLFAVIVFVHFHFDIPVFPQLFQRSGNGRPGKAHSLAQLCGEDARGIH